MKKAFLKRGFMIAETDDSKSVFNISNFESGSEVEVIREVQSNNGYRQFIIYCSKNNESTVVYDGMLNFIEEE